MHLGLMSHVPVTHIYRKLKSAMRKDAQPCFEPDGVTLLWFKRDLRVSDHAALELAAELPGAVLPVYIVEPDYWRQPDLSGRHWAFIVECLSDLDNHLKSLGGPLTIRVDEAVPALEKLRQQCDVQRMVSHCEIGNLWSFERDKKVADWARVHGVNWSEVPQSAVTRGRARATGWAKRRDQFVAAPVAQQPRVLNLTHAQSDPLPSAAQLKLRNDFPASPQTGGRHNAEAVLDDFLLHRGQTYRRAMSSPVSAENACSRLSPYLSYGVITVREAVQITRRRQMALKGSRDGWLGSLASFQSRLAWRDHFIQKLEDQPDIETRCLHSAYEGLRSETVDPVLLSAWKGGQTGVPFVDACMRYLIATGWLNFRMRAMLVSFASYQLWLDWRVTGQHLARLFTDYEPGIHWPQMQMQSGTTGINTIRIYNPVKQGLEQDPKGTFTRRWVPELSQVPDEFLQEPWRWDGEGRVVGALYPKPVVDLASATRSARERVWSIRKKAGFAEKAGSIVTRHASRKPTKPRRSVSSEKPDAKQLSFDL